LKKIIGKFLEQETLIASDKMIVEINEEEQILKFKEPYTLIEVQQFYDRRKLELSKWKIDSHSTLETPTAKNENN
jgi:hypothetical protein